MSLLVLIVINLAPQKKMVLILRQAQCFVLDLCKVSVLSQSIVSEPSDSLSTCAVFPLDLVHFFSLFPASRAQISSHFLCDTLA